MYVAVKGPDGPGRRTDDPRGGGTRGVPTPSHPRTPVEHRRTPEPGAACHAESVHVRSPSVAWRGLFATAAAALLLAGCAADARTPSAAARARPTSTTSAPTTTSTTL